MPGIIGLATTASDSSHFDASKTTSSSDEGSMEKMSGSPMMKRLTGLTQRTKAKTVKLLRLDGAAPDNQLKNEGEGSVKRMEKDPAFNSSLLVKKNRVRPGKKADKTLGTFHNIGSAVVHPVKSAKSTVARTTAGQLSKAERPFLSQKADIELLEAYDSLKCTESTGSSKQNTSDEDLESMIGIHRDNIREMEEHRESLRAAWTTIRHVRRVRVVPKRHINFPDNEYFIERDGRGDFLRFDWLKWLGNVFSHAPA